MRRSGWIVALALAAGCGPARSHMAGAKSTADVKPSSWNEALSRWTASQKVYDHLETHLIVTATWRCGAFADAYADEYARRYVLNDSAREDVRKREEADAQSYDVFFFAAYTPERDWNDFQKRDSIWRIRLYDDQGNSAEPLVINKVKDEDPVLHAFFPWFSPWTHGYVVKFAKDGLNPNAKTMKLQITSAVGAAELSYDATGANRPPMERVSAPSAVTQTP